MRKLYCISGLGADHRIFRKLSVPGFELIAVPWIASMDNESLHSYALRLLKTIPEERPTLLGLSFGGMLASEIALANPAIKAVIISSAKTRHEIGYHSEFFSILSQSGVIPASLFNIPNPIGLYLLGAVTDEEKELIRVMMRASDPQFMKWTVNALLTWTNDIVPENLVHIHGSADKVIVPRNVTAHHWIDGGSHIMIWDRAEEISALIANALGDSLT